MVKWRVKGEEGRGDTKLKAKKEYPVIVFKKNRKDDDDDDGGGEKNRVAIQRCYVYF